MLNINYLISSFFLLLLLPFLNAMASLVAPTSCGVTKIIPANQWTQIGIPCEAPSGANTVKTIIGDDMPGNYDIDWKMFSFNPLTNTYDLLGLKDILEVGKGYWLIHLHQSAQLDMPEGSRPISVESSTQCITARCFESTLVTTGAIQLQLLANPFEYAVKGEEIHVKTDQLGLTQPEIEAEGILANKIWSFNGEKYEELQNQVISPWAGIWVVTLPLASINPRPKLLFPARIDALSVPVTREQLISMINNGKDVTLVNTSEITDMSFIFKGARDSFNDDISRWDVSNVTNMRYMFSGVKLFNQDISRWNVSNVTNMRHMFSGATSFNQDINQWNVSNVTTMEAMFAYATSFNQKIRNWNVSHVTNMNFMFRKATLFNQDISLWNVSHVTDMFGMFYYATSFNQDISRWDISNVTNMTGMFSNAKNFTNQNLSGWNISSVIKYDFFFEGTSSGNIEPYWL